MTQPSYETLRLEVDADGIAVCTFDRPQHKNALNRQMVDELHAVLQHLGTDEAVRALLLCGAGDAAFVSGADIAELRERKRADAMAMINTGLLRALERFVRPTIACIRGWALGGGCELALACDLRVSGESARFGQPEVSLGIIPGAGATYRLQRLVGPGIAGELILTGRIIDAQEALRIGLVNRVVPDADVMTAGRALAAEIAKNSAWAVRYAKQALLTVAEMSTDAAMALEATTQAVLFEDEDKQRRMTAFLDKRSKRKLAMTDTLTVVGAGTMGHGIAQVAATSGYRVCLFDVSKEQLAKARAAIEQNLDAGIAKGKLDAKGKDEALARLSTHDDLGTAVREASVVIEAAPERMELKRSIFTNLTRLAPRDAVLGTNTSSLSVTEIASVTDRPERVIGMHFFNPPYALKLLELVRAEQTSDETLALARAAGERLGRELVVVNDSPGFATSRLGLVLGLEAIRMVQEGVASPADIDRAMEHGYKHPMGPLRLTDLVGLDVRLAIAEYMYNELGGDQFRPPTLLRRMVRAGKLGKKTGQGFYTW